MSFSSSAPSISPAEERHEIEMLSETERLSLARDLYGHENPVTESPEFRSLYMAQLTQALADIPDDEKEEYLHATARYGDLVEREANVMAFLRAEEYNAQAAAIRIIKYWKMRKKTFGERAFLPLNQALISDDKEILRQGYIQGLPLDQGKRKLILWKRSDMCDLADKRNHHLRAIFYVVCRLVMSDETAQLNGFVMLSNLKGFNLAQNYDRIFARLVIEMVCFCLPCRIVAMHLCFGAAGRNLWGDVLGPPVKYLYGKRLRLRVVTHGGCNSELVESLEPFGISKETLHVCLGGDVTDEYFQKWLKTQLDTEVGRISESRG